MFEVLESWLRLSAERLHDQAAALTALDQAIGDGDHGINMDRGFTAIVASLDGGVAEAETDLLRAGGMVRTAGRTLISTVGGAAGPLYGTALMRAGAAIAAADPSTPSGEVVVSALEAAIGGIASLGKATTGEKTMLDALMPAHEAGRAAVDGGASVADVIRAMADAAAAGAAATVPMLATKGRASYLGERSIGHQDPGATSSALLLRALADVVAAG
jgi:dihydroxyacetone kinase-like protein